MKKKVMLFISVIVLVVFIIVVSEVFIFKDNVSNQFIDIVEIQDKNDNVQVSNYDKFLKNDKLDKVSFSKNDFIIGGDGYLYITNTDLKEVKIKGTEINGYKTNLNNLVRLFYCDGVSHSEEKTLYALDKNGTLNFIVSSFNLEFEDISLTRMSYKNIVDIYSKEICNDNNECYIDNIARDIDGKEFSITEDYSEFYDGF